MVLRTKISDALKQAMRDKDAKRLSTLRLINAAIKDKDIALRGEGKDQEVEDSDVLQILGKMVKQRQESARAYEEGGRLELAEKELGEITVIEAFLPKQLSEAESTAAVDAAIAQSGADSALDGAQRRAQTRSNLVMGQAPVERKQNRMATRTDCGCVYIDWCCTFSGPAGMPRRYRHAARRLGKCAVLS